MYCVADEHGGFDIQQVIQSIVPVILHHVLFLACTNWVTMIDISLIVHRPATVTENQPDRLYVKMQQSAAHLVSICRTINTGKDAERNGQIRD